MAGRKASEYLFSGTSWQPLLAGSSLAVLLYAVLLAFLSQKTFPVALHSGAHWPWLMDKPVGEDSYYMLTVADNIAGHGKILYNRGLPATGIQPLATVIFAGLDLIVRAFRGGPLALIQTVLLFSSALFVLFAYQMSRMTASLCRPGVAALASALAFLLTLFDYTLFRLFTYGLETGVYLMCIAVCVAFTIRIIKAGTTTTGNMLLLGITAGLAGEARIDFGLLFAFVLGGLLLNRWITAAKAFGAGMIALLLVSPWFFFVYHVNGSWLPSSGSAESTLIAVHTVVPRCAAMLVAVVSHLAPWSFGVYSIPTLLAAFLSCAVLLWMAGRGRHLDVRSVSTVLTPLVKLWVPGIALLMLAYFLLFNSSQFYYRYASPIAVIAIPILAIYLAGSISRAQGNALVAFMACSFVFWTVGSMHTGRVSNAQAISAGYIRNYFPQRHVAAFQSGVIGYFNRDAENLDGKLNRAALQAVRSHQLPNYLDSEGIEVVIDWPSLIYPNLPPDYLARSWMPCPVPVGQTSAICIMRKPQHGDERK